MWHFKDWTSSNWKSKHVGWYIILRLKLFVVLYGFNVKTKNCYFVNYLNLRNYVADKYNHNFIHWLRNIFHKIDFSFPLRDNWIFGKPCIFILHYKTGNQSNFLEYNESKIPSPWKFDYCINIRMSSIQHFFCFFIPLGIK